MNEWCIHPADVTVLRPSENEEPHCVLFTDHVSEKNKSWENNYIKFKPKQNKAIPCLGVNKYVVKLGRRT